MEMLKTFLLRVEPFAGSDITSVATELCQLADRVGVRCEAAFNDVKLWARPGITRFVLLMRITKQ